MRTAILLVLYIIIVILLIPILAVCYIFRIREALFTIAKGAMRLGRWVLGIKLEVSGLERIDRSKPCIYMPNHLSFLDGPMMFMLIPQAVRIIIKKSVFRIPVVGWGMLFVGFVPVDRRGVKAGKKSIDHAVRSMKEKGYSFLIFPEGTRSRDGALHDFRRGGFFLAIESGAPIVPVSIKGTFELMPKGQFHARRGTVRVIFHEAVPAAQYTLETMPELIEKVRRAILAGLEGTS